MALLKTVKKIASRMKKQSRKIFGSAWDAAGSGKRFKNWWPSSESVNSLLAANLTTLRSRSRKHYNMRPALRGI